MTARPASRDPTAPTAPFPPTAPLLRSHRRWVASAVLLGLAILAYLVARTDLGRLLDTARGTTPSLLLLPALATVASYLTMARSYQGIAAAAGSPLPFGDVLRITLVANTANYLVATAGLSGFAVRIYLFGRRGIPTGSAVLISLVQTLLTNLVLLLFVITGFALLLLSQDVAGRDLVAVATLLTSFTGLVLAISLVLVHPRLRRRVLTVATDLVDRLLARVAPRRKPSRTRLLRFQGTLDDGIRFLLERPHEMTWPTVWILLDWICTLFVLYGAFVAIGYPIPIGHVIAGFAIGMFLSLVSFVPGGLGVLEGSMAAVFASLDVPLENALVAVLIFRAAYYGLPLLASMVLAHGTVRAVR